MRLLTSYRILLVSFSVALFLLSCGKGPLVEFCILDTTYDSDGRAVDLVARCVDKQQKEITRGLAELDNYVAVPSEDLNGLLQWCSHKGK